MTIREFANMAEGDTVLHIYTGQHHIETVSADWIRDHVDDNFYTLSVIQKISLSDYGALKIHLEAQR